MDQIPDIRISGIKTRRSTCSRIVKFTRAVYLCCRVVPQLCKHSWMWDGLVSCRYLKTWMLSLGLWTVDYEISEMRHRMKMGSYGLFGNSEMSKGVLSWFLSVYKIFKQCRLRSHTFPSITLGDYFGVRQAFKNKHQCKKLKVISFWLEQ